MKTTSPAVTLPARAYTDPAVFERERRELFAKSWVPVCTTAQVTEPGDFVATSIAGEPVVVIRGDDGELRAGLNEHMHRSAVGLEAHVLGSSDEEHEEQGHAARAVQRLCARQRHGGSAGCPTASATRRCRPSRPYSVATENKREREPEPEPERHAP